MRSLTRSSIIIISIIVVSASAFVILGFTSIGANLSPAIVNEIVWDDTPIDVNFTQGGSYYIFVKRISTLQYFSNYTDLSWEVIIRIWDEDSKKMIYALETGYQNFEINKVYVWKFKINKLGTYKIGIYNNLKCYCQTSKFHIAIKPSLLM